MLTIRLRRVGTIVHDSPAFDTSSREKAIPTMLMGRRVSAMNAEAPKHIPSYYEYENNERKSVLPMVSKGIRNASYRMSLLPYFGATILKDIPDRFSSEVTLAILRPSFSLLIGTNFC